MLDVFGFLVATPRVPNQGWHIWCAKAFASRLVSGRLSGSNPDPVKPAFIPSPLREYSFKSGFASPRKWSTIDITLEHTFVFLVADPCVFLRFNLVEGIRHRGAVDFNMSNGDLRIFIAFSKCKASSARHYVDAEDVVPMSFPLIFHTLVVVARRHLSTPRVLQQGHRRMHQEVPVLHWV